MSVVPDEGKLTAAKPIRELADQKIVLFTNAIVPDAGSTYAGLVLAAFSGYAPVSPVWGAPAIVAGKAQWSAAGAVFAHNGGSTAENVKGWALVRESPIDGNTLLALDLLAAPKDFAAVGDTVTVTVTQTEDDAVILPPGTPVLNLSADGVLWQDSTRTTPAIADGDLVGAWDDASANGRHATQATAGSRPMLKLALQNGRPVIRFDGADDALAGLLPLDAATASTHFLAFRPRSSVGATKRIMQSADNPATVFRNLSAAGTDSINAFDGVHVMASGDGVLANAFCVVTGRFEDLNGRIWIDGVSIAAGGDWVQRTVTDYSVGGSSGASSDFDIGQVLVYASALSDADRMAVEAYLRGRWGTP